MLCTVQKQNVVKPGPLWRCF